jgi:hypothetical protein
MMILRDRWVALLLDLLRPCGSAQRRYCGSFPFLFEAQRAAAKLWNGIVLPSLAMLSLKKFREITDGNCEKGRNTREIFAAE